jgi:hypothetical protein
MTSPSCGSDSRRLLRLALTAGLAALAQATAAQAASDDAQALPPPPAVDAAPDPSALSHLTLGAGVSAWNGTFGAPRTTNIDAALLNARYSLGGLRLTASVPWMRIDSDGAIFTGVEGTPIIVAPTISPGKRIRQGFGDLTLGAAYLLPARSTYGFDVDLIGRVKLPTADKDTGLSTRHTDYAFGTQVSRSFGSLSPFVSVTYRVFGGGDYWRLHDGIATSVGAAYVFPRGVVGSLSYDYARSASAYASDADEITGSLSTPLPHTPLRLNAFVAGGLSNGAAAVTGGLSLSLKL